jgi:hypothetical protein
MPEGFNLHAPPCATSDDLWDIARLLEEAMHPHLRKAFDWDQRFQGKTVCADAQLYEYLSDRRDEYEAYAQEAEREERDERAYEDQTRADWRASRGVTR